MGRIGERALAKFEGVRERIVSLTKTAGFRIPDLLDKAGKTLYESKNVGSLALTNQLKDFLAFAQANGLQFVLQVRPDTQLSAPLQKLVDLGLIKVILLK